MESDLTIEQLAALLGLSRRTIERAIKAKSLVPASLTPSGRPRFSSEQSSELKIRADEARALGCKYVIVPVTTAGAVRRRRPRRKDPPLTADQWFRRMMWKRQNVARTKRPRDGSP